MSESFKELCKRLDDMLIGKKMLPSGTLTILHEYMEWRECKKAKDKQDEDNERM